MVYYSLLTPYTIIIALLCGLWCTTLSLLPTQSLSYYSVAYGVLLSPYSLHNHYRTTLWSMVYSTPLAPYTIIIALLCGLWCTQLPLLHTQSLSHYSVVYGVLNSPCSIHNNYRTTLWSMVYSTPLAPYTITIALLYDVLNSPCSLHNHYRTTLWSMMYSIPLAPYTITIALLCGLWCTTLSLLPTQSLSHYSVVYGVLLSPYFLHNHYRTTLWSMVYYSLLTPYTITIALLCGLWCTTLSLLTTQSLSHYSVVYGVLLSPYFLHNHYRTTLWSMVYYSLLAPYTITIVLLCGLWCTTLSLLPTQSLSHYSVAYGVLLSPYFPGFGQSLAQVGSTVGLAYYFPTSTVFAAGIALSGNGFASFIHPALLQILLGKLIKCDISLETNFCFVCWVS